MSLPMMVVREWQSYVENLALQEDVGGAEAVAVYEFLGFGAECRGERAGRARFLEPLGPFP